MNELLVSVAETGPSLTIRATVLFAVASGVALALGKASAAQRHLVWAAALAASLVLPVMHVCAPEWGVLPAFTAKHTSSPAMREAPMAGESPSASMAVASFHESPRGAERAASAAVSPPASPAPPRAAALSVSVSVGQALAVLWLTGVLLGCVRLALAAGRIRQLARRADPATGRMAALLAELARESGIRRPVQGLVSRQSIVLMTWGWLRPVVLLPADAASWSAARLRVVLLHELAHVRRGDAATQLVAELARSLYWFHPLSWWGVRCLRVEQEAACDDRVLAAGAAAEDYAEELVAVTARLPHGLPEPGLAVAMGRRHTIEGRVRGILADDRDRRPVRMVRAAVIGGVFAMLATVAAIVGPAADAEDKPTVSDARPAAAELPADTNKIERLTPQQARKLAEEFPGLAVDVEIKPNGPHRYHRQDGVLPLNGLKSLAPETARELAHYRKKTLLLSGLTELDPETAAALAKFNGDILFLNGLTSVDAPTANALAQFRGTWLSLAGLKHLGADAAEELSKAQTGGCLYLYGLKTISADAARALAKCDVRFLQLSGITTVDVETAAALGRSTSYLHLDGLTRLNAETARGLAAYRGSVLSLSGLATLDAETAKALADFRGLYLALGGLTTLDAAAATSLAAFKGDPRGSGRFHLTGLTTLSADSAKTLAQIEKWCGKLPGIIAFDSPDSVAVAKALATRKGPLSLPNLKKISPKTLSALLEKDDIDIPLIETLELIPEPDGSPTEDFVIPERFQKR